jgi:hypothetical protein
VTAPSNLPTLYRNHQILVWVEDEVTRTYLREVWQDSNIGLLIAGGHENIHAVVKSARAQGFLHVFGFRDRDFGGTNRPKWQDDPEGVLTSEVFEVENLALDSQAMFACQLNSSKMTAEQISARLRELASKRCWWMSCRHAITDVRNAITDKFVEHPKLGKVTTQAEAEESHLCEQVVDCNPARHRSINDRCVRTDEPSAAPCKVFSAARKWRVASTLFREGAAPRGGHGSVDQGASQRRAFRQRASRLHPLDWRGAAPAQQNPRRTPSASCRAKNSGRIAASSNLRLLSWTSWSLTHLPSPFPAIPDQT